MEQDLKEFQNIFREMQVRFSRYFAHILADRNISVSQFSVMFHLAQEGSMPMNRLAQKMRISKPAVTNLIDRLVRANYLRRKADPQDRRVIFAQLTKKGDKVVRRAQGRMLDFLTSTVSSFSKEERGVIKKFYQVLAQNFDRTLDKT